MRFDLRKRLNTIEAKAATAITGDIGSRVLAARQSSAAPTHYRSELEALGQGNDLVARIARGMLRIGHCLAGEASRASGPALIPDEVLPQMAGALYADPLAFCLFAFDFGFDRSLRVVKLPKPWNLVYESEFGVEQWACEFFDELGQQVKDRAFDGEHAVDPIRHAVSSGHGVSKSATTAMLVNWLMSTRPNARGVVTANTAPQLESKTWSELAKWTRRSVFADWFDVTTGRGSMRMSHKERPESWNCFGQTAAEERSESFAGLHSADSTPFFIFDEASAIPSKIWETAEGGMTDGEPHWYCFGNPTRTGTKFFECFNGQRHRWVGRVIDSRDVSITNKAQLDEWIADFGLDSDFVKVRVLGIFPSASSLQFISGALVDEAMQREAAPFHYETVVLGVDVARFGDDSSVIYARTGRDAASILPIRLRGLDTMQVAARVAEQINLYRSASRRVMTLVDGGGVGGGVIDRLRSLDFDVHEIQFGGRALDDRKYANRRAEIWGLLKDALPGLSLPNDRDLRTELTSVEYSFNARDQILLEKKESMKSRGLASPDLADALALTFALPVPVLDRREIEDQQRARQAEKDYWDRGALPLDVQEHDPYRRSA